MPSFHIRNIQTTIRDFPLRPERIVVSAAGRHDASVFLIVTMEGDDGLRGYGEAATVPLWSGETAGAAQRIVEEVFAPYLNDATFDHPCEVQRLLDRAAVGNSFAKSALDTAAWDLFARQQDKSVLELVTQREQPVPRLPTRASIAAGSVEATVRLARTFYEAGIRTLKFKVGLPGDDDPARLRAVRDELGPDVSFTIDANGGYPTADAAVRGIEAMLPFNLAVVEQPTPRDRLAMLAEVHRRLDAPLMADEAIFTPDDLAEALDLDAMDLVALYPGKHGGFTHALAMADTAGAAGKRCAIGSNLETDLGQAATATLAAAHPAFPVEEVVGDFPAALFYQGTSVDRPLKLVDGCLEAPRGPGFGVVPGE